MKVKTKICIDCGHTHEGEFCKNAFCDVCGLGGDLTSMPCDIERHKKLEKRCMELFPSGKLKLPNKRKR